MIATTDNPSWSGSVAWDMPSFLDRYTLHDSDLVSVMIEPAGAVVVACHLDLGWNKSVPQGFDALVLAFERTYSLSYRGGSSFLATLAGATSKLCSEAERAALHESDEFDLRAYQGRSREVDHPSQDHSLTRTGFESVYFAQLIILHGAPIRCRCFNETGESVDLAGV